MRRFPWAIVIIIVLCLIGAYVALFLTKSPGENTPTQTAQQRVQTYANDAFGVSFQYDSTEVGVVAEGTSTIAVYATGTVPSQGQSIMRFSKPTDETFEQSIRRQILAGYSTTTCTVESAALASGYVKAEISYPVPVESPLGHEELCNAAYDKTNGIRYFLYDPNHADRFYFVSIGQYPLLASSNTPWQDTIVIR